MLTHDPDSLTYTEWQVAEYSEPFIIRSKGRCMFTGRPFSAGASVRRVKLASGAEGYLDRDGVHGIGWINDRHWFTRMCLDMAKLPEFLLHPELRQITLFNGMGMPMRFTQRAVDGSWLKNESTIVSAKQFAAWSAKSRTFSASRSVTFPNQLVRP